jgi:hypothetical protein
MNRLTGLRTNIMMHGPVAKKNLGRTADQQEVRGGNAGPRASIGRDFSTLCGYRSLEPARRRVLKLATH